MSETNNDAPLQIRGNGRLTPEPSSRAAIEALEEPESSDLELEEYLRLLLRRKWTVFGCLAVVLGLAVCYIAVAPRIYEATATFLVSEPTGAMEKALETELPPMAAAISAPELETHAALLQGPIVAEETAAWLKANGGPDMSAEELRRIIRTSIVPKTQLIQLKARAESRAVAERIATATAECYTNMNRRLALSSSDSSSRYLTQQIGLAKDNLAQAEKALRDFEESTGTVAVGAGGQDSTGASAADAETKTLVDRMASIHEDLGKSQADLAQAQERESRVRAQLLVQNKSIGARQVRDNNVVQQLRAHLVDLEGQRLAIQAKYSSSFSAPREQLDDQIRVAQGQLNKEIGNIVRTGGGDLTMQQALTAQLSQGEIEGASLTARVQHLKRDMAAVEANLRHVPARQIVLARLQRQVEVSQTIHSDLLKRSQETEVSKVMALGNATLVEPARAPRLPVAPRVLLILALGLILGLGLGFGLALLKERLDDSVRGEDDVLRLTDAPVLGSVPLFDKAEKAAMLAGGHARRRGLEAYFGLRYNLGFLMPMPRSSGQTVLVTSAGPQEGKTTTAVYLALAAAMAGRRTVLVDADLRLPSIHQFFSLDGTRGLSDVIAGQISLQPVQVGENMDLKVLRAGTRAPDPANLLDSTAMRSLVQELRQQADIIIFDSPPLLSAVDSLVLAGMSDAVLLVCVPGASHRRALTRARVLLNTVGAHISGVVLNKLEPRAGHGYYYLSHDGRDKRTDVADSVSVDQSSG
jgi:capsular exopolysaccharide synthesis family protein